MTAVGHEDAFLRPRLSARCRFSQGTFAGTRGNGRDRRLQTFPPLRVLALAGLLIPDAKKPIRLDESLAEPAYHCHRPLFSDVADVRQHLLAEQFERFHQLIGMFRARVWNDRSTTPTPICSRH